MSGSMMDCSPQNIIFNPQLSAPSLLKIIPVTRQPAHNFPISNSQNVNPNLLPIVPSAESRYRKILPKQSNLPIANPQVNSAKTEAKTLPETTQKDDSKQSKVPVVDLTEDKGEQSPRKRVNKGVEVVVHIRERGASCENYNFFTKNKKRTR